MACKWWDEAAVQPCTFCIPQWPSLVTLFYINIVNCIIYVLVDLDTCSLVSGNQEGKKPSLTQWELIVFIKKKNQQLIASYTDTDCLKRGEFSSSFTNYYKKHRDKCSFWAMIINSLSGKGDRRGSVHISIVERTHDLEFRDLGGNSGSAV